MTSVNFVNYRTEIFQTEVSENLLSKSQKLAILPGTLTGPERDYNGTVTGCTFADPVSYLLHFLTELIS